MPEPAGSLWDVNILALDRLYRALGPSKDDKRYVEALEYVYILAKEHGRTPLEEYEHQREHEGAANGAMRARWLCDEHNYAIGRKRRSTQEKWLKLILACWVYDQLGTAHVLTVGTRRLPPSASRRRTRSRSRSRRSGAPTRSTPRTTSTSSRCRSNSCSRSTDAAGEHEQPRREAARLPRRARLRAGQDGLQA